MPRNVLLACLLLLATAAFGQATTDRPTRDYDVLYLGYGYQTGAGREGNFVVGTGLRFRSGAATALGLRTEIAAYTGKSDERRLGAGTTLGLLLTGDHYFKQDFPTGPFAGVSAGVLRDIRYRLGARGANTIDLVTTGTTGFGAGLQAGYRFPNMRLTLAYLRAWPAGIPGYLSLTVAASLSGRWRPAAAAGSGG